MPLDYLQILAREQEKQKLAEEQAMASLTHAQLEQEIKKSDLPGYGAGYKAKYQKQLEKVVQQETETAKFQAENIQLKNGDWLSRESFNKLDKENQARINELGIDKYNQYLADKKTEFETSNVLVGEKEWIPKTDYEKLTPALQKYIKQMGIEKFNTTLKSDATIKKEMPEYWKELEQTNVYISGGESAIPRDIYQGREGTVTDITPVGYRIELRTIYNKYNEPIDYKFSVWDGGWVDKKFYDSLNAQQKQELKMRGVKNFEASLKNPNTPYPWEGDERFTQKTWGAYENIVYTPQGAGMVSGGVFTPYNVATNTFGKPVPYEGTLAAKLPTIPQIGAVQIPQSESVKPLTSPQGYTIPATNPDYVTSYMETHGELPPDAQLKSAGYQTDYETKVGLSQPIFQRKLEEAQKRASIPISEYNELASAGIVKQPIVEISKESEVMITSKTPISPTTAVSDMKLLEGVPLAVDYETGKIYDITNPAKPIGIEVGRQENPPMSVKLVEEGGSQKVLVNNVSPLEPITNVISKAVEAVGGVVVGGVDWMKFYSFGTEMPEAKDYSLKDYKAGLISPKDTVVNYYALYKVPKEAQGLIRDTISLKAGDIPIIGGIISETMRDRMSAQYNPSTKSIIVVPDTFQYNFDAYSSEVVASTIAHEVAHDNWNKLSQSEKESFIRDILSPNGELIKNKPQPGQWVITSKDGVPTGEEIPTPTLNTDAINPLFAKDIIEHITNPTYENLIKAGYEEGIANEAYARLYEIYAKSLLNGDQVFPSEIKQFYTALLANDVKTMPLVERNDIVPKSVIGEPLFPSAKVIEGGGIPLTADLETGKIYDVSDPMKPVEIKASVGEPPVIKGVSTLLDTVSGKAYAAPPMDNYTTERILRTIGDSQVEVIRISWSGKGFDKAAHDYFVEVDANTKEPIAYSVDGSQYVGTYYNKLDPNNPIKCTNEACRTEEGELIQAFAWVKSGGLSEAKIPEVAKAEVSSEAKVGKPSVEVSKETAVGEVKPPTEEDMRYLQENMGQYKQEKEGKEYYDVYSAVGDGVDKNLLARVFGVDEINKASDYIKDATKIPDGKGGWAWIKNADVPINPNQRDILFKQGYDRLIKNIKEWEQTLEPYKVSLPDGSTSYNVHDALIAGREDIKITKAIESLMLPKDVVQYKKESGTLEVPAGLASENEFFKMKNDILNQKPYLDYTHAHPDDPRVQFNMANYGAAVLLKEASVKPEFERRSAEADAYLQRFGNILKEIQPTLKKITIPDAIKDSVKAISGDENNPFRFFGIMGLLPPIGIAGTQLGTKEQKEQAIQIIDTAKQSVRNFWTEAELDKWMQDNNIGKNNLISTGILTGKWIFDMVKTIGADIPLTIVDSSIALNNNDVAKAATDIAELTGGMALFPVSFVGGLNKNMSKGEYDKAAASAVGLALTIVIPPEAMIKYGQRLYGKITGFPKTFSPGTGSVTIDIPMSGIGKQTPGAINTLNALQEFIKAGDYARDTIFTDSNGKLVTRITPLARTGITQDFHVTNRFNEYANALKAGNGVINDISKIASRDSPFPGQGAYFSPNISIRTATAIEPVGGKTGVIAYGGELKATHPEVQKIYNELSTIDFKRTPFDVVADILKRAEDKYVALEEKGEINGHYTAFKGWSRVNYKDLIDLMKSKGVSNVRSWDINNLTEKQIEQLNKYYSNLDSKTKGSITEFWLENEGYHTKNAPLYATKPTFTTTIKELGDKTAGNYIRASEDFLDPAGNLVVKKGSKVPIMWLSDKPNQLPPSFKQRMTAEYIYEPLTTLRKLLSIKPKNVNIGYGGWRVGDLIGLEIKKRPNVNDYLNLDSRATAIIRNPKNPSQILVGRQFNADTGKLENHYDTIGGAPFKIGESPMETVVREVADEAGAYAIGGKYIGTTKGRHMTTKAKGKYVEDERVFDLYETKYAGVLKPSGEVRDLAWYDGEFLYDLNGIPKLGQRVSDMTPKLYRMAESAPKNIEWNVTEPKRNIQTELPQTFKKEGFGKQDKWTVKTKSEEAIAILEDSSGNPLLVNNGVIKTYRQKGETVAQALNKEVQKLGMTPSEYSYVQTWQDFPYGQYSDVYPGQMKDLYVVKVNNPSGNTRIATIDELKTIEPRYGDAYSARKPTLKFEPVITDYTAKPTYLSADLPLTTKLQIGEIQTKLKDIATEKKWDFIDWQNPQNFHLTLKYMGNIPIVKAKLTSQIINDINMRMKLNPISFKIGEWEAWPNYKDVGVISLRLKTLGDMGKVTELQRAIDAAVTKAGLSPDTYRFEPHITVASVKEGTPIQRKIELGAYLGKNPVKLDISGQIDNILFKESGGGKLYKTLDEKSVTYVDDVGKESIKLDEEMLDKPESKISSNELEERPYKPPKETTLELYPAPYEIVKGAGVKEYATEYGKPKEYPQYLKSMEYTTYPDYEKYSSYPTPKYPKYPETKYPEYPAPKYPEYPQIEYPKYPELEYPEYPTPKYPKYPEPKYPTYPIAKYPQYPEPKYSQYPPPKYPKYPPPKYPEYPPPKTPKIPPPPPPPPPLKGQEGFESLTRAQKLASISWKQGWIFHLVYPPYGFNNVLHSRYPFPGVHVYKGVKSAYKSLARLKGNVLPEKVYWNMGQMDITFQRGKGKVQMEYVNHPKGQAKIRRPEGMPKAVTFTRKKSASIGGVRF